MTYNVLRFRPEPVESRILSKMEEAARKNGLGTLPSFFVFIRRQDIIEQLELLNDTPDAALGAPLLVCAFFALDDETSSQKTLLVLSDMMRIAEENGCAAQYVTFVRGVFNNNRYNKLKAACGVPEGYACVGAISVGMAEKTAETEEKHSFFSYVQ